MPGRAEADVVLLGLLPRKQSRGGSISAVAAGRRRRPRGGWTSFSASATIRLVLEVAGGADDDLRAGVAGVVVALDVRDRDVGDHLGLAEHPAAERVLPKTASASTSWTRSWGSSSYIAISSITTWRSESISG